MIIPDKIKEILEKDLKLDGLVKSTITSFEPILKDNNLFFFEEYTDHGIEHVEMVLKAVEFLIHEDSYKYLEPTEISILIFAIILHDIGMHAEFSTFKAMIDGKYDDVRVDVLDKKTWTELWDDYLLESRHWSSKKLDDIFGNSNEIPKIPDLSDKDKLTGIDKKLIGEFIRRNHARLAHEIALKGFICNNNDILKLNAELDERDKQLIGIISRSHGLNIRDTFTYLKQIAQEAWGYPDGLNVVFLMVLLRIADYIQIDKTRTNKILLKLKTFNSPVSLMEHKVHLCIGHIHFGKIREPELIYVECDKPQNAQMYVKMQKLIKEIQYELDLSWAVLGEVYGFNPENKPKFKYRRIDSNLKELTLDYVPKKISFEINKELSKLLVAPLYGDNPAYGVRELIQNATDACKERIKIENDKENNNYDSLVEVSIAKIDEEKYLFKIKDNGKGMTLDEILNYFLSVGSSFRKTLEWKKEFTEKGKSVVNRNGKFGIGILAAFLLGDNISVKTRSIKENSKIYSFETKLDTDFIDINTIDNFEIGTEIEIEISKETLDILISKNNLFEDINWIDWYIGQTPTVKYTLFEESQKPKEFFKPTKYRCIESENYYKVQWDYLKENLRYRSIFVACNDIIITLESNGFFYFGSNVIIQKPDVSIYDPQGNLPLSLNRNKLENGLPFEEELFRDVCLDFIARILTLHIPFGNIKKYSLFPHNADFLFLKNGFSLDIDYFISKIKDKTLLRILTSDKDKMHDISIILNHFENLILYPQYSQLYYLRGQKERITPDTNAHIILLKQRYNDYFEYELRIPQRLKHKHNVKWRNDNFVAYTMNNFQSQLSLFQENEFTNISDKFDSNIQSIQEMPLSYIKINRGGYILNQLFEKYIGSNVIIPYDMEERKRLYPLAFEELHNYMNDYMKNS
ncbi:MAG: ATP-binding protein [Erysipelotrichales bacterium]|nr:ATP-binding protein [Erysipelotrichales bacterium]